AVAVAVDPVRSGLRPGAELADRLAQLARDPAALYDRQRVGQDSVPAEVDRRGPLHRTDQPGQRRLAPAADQSPHALVERLAAVGSAGATARVGTQRGARAD